MRPKKQFRVAMLAEAWVAPRRRILAGIARYMYEHEPWAIYLKPWLVEKSLNDWIREWDGDGIISAAWGPEAAEVESIDIPIVDVTGHLRHLGVPLVHTNDRAVGRLCAEHLLDRNFQNFGFIEYPAGWAQDRRLSFAEALAAKGFQCDVHTLNFPVPGSGGPGEWDKQQQAMVQWVRQLPKPVGVMTCTDMIGQQFLESCQRAGFVVPEQVAVIGADNDELICEICYPKLSTVIIDDFRRGYQTASVLAQLMAGNKGPKDPIYVDPPGVVCRASTDILAIDDEDVAKALRYIREHGCECDGVDEVLRVVAISRTVLEKRFRKVVNRSINDEIVRVRLNRAIELLTATDLKLETIASKSGFNSPSYMGAVFRDKIGRTPGSFRDPKKVHELQPGGVYTNP